MSKSRIEPTQVVSVEDVTDEFHGPIENRGCTDVLCLIVFIAFIGGMGYVAVVGYGLGDPLRLIYSTDSWGNTCGRSNNQAIDGVRLSGMDLSSQSNVFTFDYEIFLDEGFYESTRLCVASCPNETFLTTDQIEEYANDTGVLLCRYDIDWQTYVQGAQTPDLCPTLPVSGTVAKWHHCIPEDLLNLASNLAGILNHIEAQCEESGEFFDQVVSDVMKTWKDILYLCLGTVGVSFLVIILMRCFSTVLIWTIFVGSGVSAIAATIVCWLNYGNRRSELNASDPAHQSSAEKYQVRIWLFVSIVVTIFTVIILLILLIFRKRVALVIQLFTEASKVMMSIPLLLLQPIWTLIFYVSSVVFFLFFGSYLETAGHPLVNNSTGYVTFKDDTLLTYMKWYYLFGIFWISEFINACHLMVIAGVVSAWYFTRRKSELSSPISSSIYRLSRYHLGSVAFGSFIIALVQFIRFVLGHIQNKLDGRSGKVVDFILTCLRCCLWFFEKILKFINKNAYIMIAIHGYNFCRGAQRGLQLLIDNILRVAAINSIGWFTLFLCKVFITGIMVTIALYIFKARSELCYIWLPLVLTGFAAYLIAHIFISIYEMAIDTIFLCFCEDCELNDGTIKPYFMSKQLMKFVKNSREALDALDQPKTRVVKIG